MLFSTISQPLIFLWMMFCGGVIALWYALTALIRRITQAGFWISLMCDLVFGIGCAVIFILGLVIADYGRLRLYSVLGAVLGAIMTKFALITPLCCVFGRIGSFLMGIVTKLAEFRTIKVLFK